MATVPEITEEVKLDVEQIEEARKPTVDETNILNTLDFFDKYDNSQYKTFDDAKKLLESDLNADVLEGIVGEFKLRADKDIEFKEKGGRDLNIANDTFNKVIKNVDIDKAKTLNFTNLDDNYNSIKEFIDSDDVYKLAGINPQEGAPSDARLSFAFSLQNPDTITSAAHNAIVYTLPKEQQEKYTGLNYKGPRIHVDNYKFVDGKERIIYKVPKELGGDGNFRLFNEPGEWSKDVIGFAPQIAQIATDATVGALTAAGGPAAVSVGTGVSSFISDYTRLKIGQLYFNQNKDLSEEDLILEAAKTGAISGAATRVLFPIANLVNRSLRSAGATVGLSEGNLSKKVIGDFVDAYKKGLNKDIDNDQFIKNIKDQLTKDKDLGGAGVSKEDADVLIKKTFSQNLPGTRLANIETAVKKDPKGKGFPTPLLVGKGAEDAAIQAEKIGLDVQKKVLSDITGVDISKINALDTTGDAFKVAQNIAKSDYRANLLRQDDFSKKFLDNWSNLSKKYKLKTQPEEQNFNIVLQKFLDPVKTENFAKAEKLRGTINELTKDVRISIPRTNLNKGFVSPSKIFDESIKGLNKTINKSKELNIPEKDLQDLYDSRNLLKNLKVTLKTKKDLNYLDVEDTLTNIEYLKGKYPNLDQSLTQVQTSLRAARSEVINKLPKGQRELITKNLYEFNKDNAMLKSDVLGKVISNLKGVRGPIAKNKALTAPDQFSVLFGNKQEQLQALRYLKSASSGKLTKPRFDELKTIMIDRFIKDVTPTRLGGKGIPVAKWNSEYGKAYSQIFTPKEMTNFRNLINARSAAEKIVGNTLRMNQAARNVFPTLKNIDISNMTPYNIADALFDPKLKSSQVKKFFNTIGGEQAETIQAHYLQRLFNQTKTASPLLQRETLDGSKLFNLLNDSKTEAVFSNVFSPQQFKNLKTVAAALDFMQNSSRFIGKEMTEAQEDQVRRTATRIIYGPLSHENIVISGLVKGLNSLDNKLGKELLDYDLFVEKFKKTYAAKYAPALNDEKFLKLFDKYDAGLLQRGYTGALSGLGTTVAQDEEALEDAGLPRGPISGVPEVLDFAGEQVSKIPYVKETGDSLQKILDTLKTSEDTKVKKETVERLKKIKKELDKKE